MKKILIALTALLIVAAPVAVFSQNQMKPQAYLPIAMKKEGTWRTLFSLPNSRPLTDVVFYKDGYYASAQTGQIYNQQGQVVMTIPVDSRNEKGLNGLASNGLRMWAAYVAPSGEMQVAEVFIEAGLYVPIASFGNAAIEHNVADLLYANSRLYLGIGDNMEKWSAQDDSSPWGRIWEIDPNRRTAHSYSKGYRNPWAIASIDDKVYIADVGESQKEEIDIYSAGIEDLRTNALWPCYEGDEKRSYYERPDICKDIETHPEAIKPYFAYDRHIGTMISGVAKMNGKIVFSDLTGGINVAASGIEPIKRFPNPIIKMTPAGAGIAVTTATWAAISETGIVTVEVYE